MWDAVAAEIASTSEGSAFGRTRGRKMVSTRAKRDRFVLVSLTAVALLVFAACGQGAAPATPAARPTEAPASPQPVKGAEVLVPTQVPTKPAAETPKPAASSAVKLDLPVPREETLVIATGPTEAITIPDSFNPFTPRGVQPGVNWNAAMNEPLLYHNVEGTTPDEEWIGGLGEKFDYNKDFTSYTVRLR